MSGKPKPGYESLTYLLKDRADGRLGVEDEIEHENGIYVYTDRSSSGVHRIVKRGDTGTPIAAILIREFTDLDGFGAQIDAIYTKRNHRRRGVAAELIEFAKSMFPRLVASDDQSAAGRELFKATGLA